MLMKKFHLPKSSQNINISKLPSLQLDTFNLCYKPKLYFSSIYLEWIFENWSLFMSHQYCFNDTETFAIDFYCDSPFFSIWIFFHKHSRFTGQQGKGEGIYLIPLYHFHPLHRHLGISRAMTAESSPLHIASSWTRTGYLWFPSASC